MILKRAILVLLSSLCLLTGCTPDAIQADDTMEEVNVMIAPDANIDESGSGMEKSNSSTSDAGLQAADSILLDAYIRDGIDVNGDGRSDAIHIEYWGENFDEYTDDSYLYVYSLIMQIGSESMGKQFEIFSMEIPDVEIVDLDTEDDAMEIAVVTTVDGPGAEVYFFRYGDDAPVLLGSVRGTLRQDDEYCPPLILKGDGLFFGPKRTDILHTFDYYVPYRAASSDIVKLSDDVYRYCEPVCTKVLQDFGAFRSRDTNAGRFTLKKGQEIELVATDGEKWVQFFNNNGEEGWILSDDEGRKIFNGGNAEDYLEGLYFYG